MCNQVSWVKNSIICWWCLMQPHMKEHYWRKRRQQHYRLREWANLKRWRNRVKRKVMKERIMKSRKVSVSTKKQCQVPELSCVRKTASLSVEPTAIWHLPEKIRNHNHIISLTKTIQVELCKLGKWPALKNRWHRQSRCSRVWVLGTEKVQWLMCHWVRELVWNHISKAHK